VCVKAYRGFESHSFRQVSLPTICETSRKAPRSRDFRKVSHPSSSHLIPPDPGNCRVSNRVASLKNRVSTKNRRKPKYNKAIFADDSLNQRFWSKVQKTDGCWLWTAALDDKGYGLFKLDRAMQKAHRVAWRMIVGSTGCFDLLHTCDNPRCVRPDHMRLGTHSENMKDCASKGRLNWQTGKTSQINISKWRQEWLLHKQNQRVKTRESVRTAREHETCGDTLGDTRDSGVDSTGGCENG
jgi:hypothetical protein